MDTHIARVIHNIYACRIHGDSGLLEYCNDNGEFSAGRRVLRILKEHDIINKLVVVSRWYGGRHLGPARFKCIEDAAREACKLSNR